jgi:uncharacterized membrane protein YgdD (TMEM256/DUF423 family)
MRCNAKAPIVLAAIALALATALGALGAHGLQQTLSPARLADYEVAVRYQFFQALGLFGIGIVSRERTSSMLTSSAWLVLAGLVLFSGSIYALCFGAPRFVGFLTPLGGLALILGWLLFAVGYCTAAARPQ